MTALVELLRRPRYEVFPLGGIEEQAAEHLPGDVKVTVTSSPARGIDTTLEFAARLAGRGFEVVPHLASGRMRAIVDRIFPAEEAADAFDYMASSGKFGKVLLAF